MKQKNNNRFYLKQVLPWQGTFAMRTPPARTIYCSGRLCVIMTVLMAIAGCNHHTNNTVTDIDGNVYRTVTIGKQVWMAENLKVTRYRNGDSISHIADAAAWSTYSAGAYCNYNNHTGNTGLYGRLYNWHAVTDHRNIAPKGWHIPTEAELLILINYLGGDTIAAGNMKVPGITQWLYPNAGATNGSGFAALPGGYRFGNDASFHTLGSNGYWWLADGSYALYAWSPRLFIGFADVKRDKRFENYGLAVRCVKD